MCKEMISPTGLYLTLTYYADFIPLPVQSLQFSLVISDFPGEERNLAEVESDSLRASKFAFHILMSVSKWTDG